ncbi:MAG: biosynthetic-type acetolactate synthase large subunit, partial [Bacteroidales bacterium]|nr:biosynthetic-type acetolactate synthase large subunit [Bacteroidales bacterium]
MATSGPGATNLITGIADAMLDSTPIVCITAQVFTDKLGTSFFQEADTISITIPVTKWNYQITEANEVADIMAKAFYVAKSGRPGPVLISFTRNAQTELTNYLHRPYKPFKIRERSSYDENLGLIPNAANLINESKKPMIIVGQGVVLSNAEKESLGVAQKGNIPLVSTLMGISAIPTNHPLFMGNVGMHGNLAPNRMTQESDLIIAVGMRFSDRVTGDTSKYAPKAKIIHIDIDKAEFNKNVKSDIQILGNAKEVLINLTPLLKQKKRESWFQFIEEQKCEEKQLIADKYLAESEETTISMAQVVNTIARVCEGNAVIVTDVGQHQMFGARFSEFNHNRSFITSGGLGTMGFGLPAAIGAKHGVPDREVVVITGDGGFQMSIQELGTIMQTNVNLKIVVLNNSFLGMVRQWQELFFDRRYSFTEMVNPNFVEIANAYKIPGLKIDKYKELEESVLEMIKHKGAFLLEVAVKSEENIFPMIPGGASLDNILY